MRNNIKENILELIQTLYEAHSNVETLIKEKDNQSVCALLEDCQNAAIHIGESIEQSEGENFITVKYLEAYCELLYTTSVNISNGIYEKIKENLNAQLHVIEDSVRDDIKGKWEIVFLRWKVYGNGLLKMMILMHMWCRFLIMTEIRTEPLANTIMRENCSLLMYR